MHEFTYDELFPRAPGDDGFLAWDGSRPSGQEIVKKEAYEYSDYPPKEFEIASLKASSSVLFHRRKKDREFAVDCFVKDIIRFYRHYEKMVLCFGSGARSWGRLLRNIEHEKIRNDNYVDEIYDFEWGQRHLYGKIQEKLKQEGIDSFESLVTHEDFRDKEAGKKTAEIWAEHLSKGQVVWVNENDAESLRQINRIFTAGGKIISLADVDPKKQKNIIEFYSRSRVFGDNDGLQYHGSVALVDLGFSVVGLNYTINRGIRPLDYFTKGPLKKYGAFGIIIDHRGLETQIDYEEETKPRSRGGCSSKITYCGEAVLGGVEEMVVCQANYPFFDHTYKKGLVNERQLRPPDGYMEGRFFGTKFIAPEPTSPEELR
jgi:SAM-dependent methyltransferase